MKFSVNDTFYELCRNHSSNRLTFTDENGNTWYRYANEQNYYIEKNTIVGIVKQIVEGQTVNAPDASDYELGTAAFYHVVSSSGLVKIYDAIDLEHYIDRGDTFHKTLESVQSKYPGAKYEG